MTPSPSRSEILFLFTVALQASVLALAPLSDAQAGEDARLTLNFVGIQKPGGAIMAGVFTDQAAFDAGRASQGVRIPVSGPAARQVITGLKPGRYAIKAFHDVNGDGRMNTNPFGLPTEPYAASNNARGAMKPPAWSDAVFTVVAGDNVQTITID